MRRMVSFVLLLTAAVAWRSRAEVVPPDSPQEMAAALESRIVSGDGVTLPDAEREIARVAGTVDLAAGDWPEAFLARAGESVCVAVSPFTGCYEFFDETGEVFWTVVPVLPTTENWVAPFRHAKDGPHPDDDLYAPWRLVDMWMLSHAEFESHAEFAESAEFFDLDFGFVDKDGQLRFVNNPRGAADPATNLCITAFSFTETNLFFSASWPTNETLPDATFDLYGTTNLLSPSWLFLSSHPATNPPAGFAVEPATLPWYVEPTQHVHDAACESVTNVVASPLDGVTAYTNVFWSCETNRAPVPPGFFRLGTRHDTDGDGLPDAFELLVQGTRPDRLDSDGDGVPDGVSLTDWWRNPLWATNAGDADFIVDLVAPTDGSAETILSMDGVRIPLSPSAGPWAFKLPRGRVVPCSVSSSGPFFILWCGAPGGSFWDPDPSFEKPLWTSEIGNISGYHTEGGSCLLAVPELMVEPDFCPEDPTNSIAGTGSHRTELGSICIHETDGILRYSWNVAPAIVGQGRQPVVTGPLRFDSAGLYADVSGTTGDLTGTVTLTDTPSAVGTLHKSPATDTIQHRCIATSWNPYCQICGNWAGMDLFLSSTRTNLTLKHDNMAAFSIIHPNSPGEPIENARFFISRPGYGDWIPLVGSNLTARIAGQFKIRGFVNTSDDRTLRTTDLNLVVQFPSEEEMIADPSIVGHTSNLWTQTLALCTETIRHEVGCWILLDTSTDTYSFTTTTNGPPTPNDRDSSIDLGNAPMDIPAFPSLQHGAAVYTVASFHTHTPTTYRDPGDPRIVGASPNDKTNAVTFRMPGIVYDYEESSQTPGCIPMGHPKLAPASPYPTEVFHRRPNP